MSNSDAGNPAPVVNFDKLVQRLDDAIAALDESRDFAKLGKLPRLFDIVRRVLLQPEGCLAIEQRAERLEKAGVFLGTDWADPSILLPSLTTFSLQSPQADTVIIEGLSELRLLAVARGEYLHESMSAEQAHHYLTQVLAINLNMLFGEAGEAEREQGKLALVSRAVVQHVATQIGYEHVIDQLIEEIWRILQQRPIQVSSVRQMITQIALCRIDPNVDLGGAGQGAERLISSLYGPTQACREDPGIPVYQERLQSMDAVALQSEATGFARSMHDTGLVSPYHATFVRHILESQDALLTEALGLSSTGRDCLLCYKDLVHELINEGVYPETAQGLYGLALMLERGILYQPPLAPALWRQARLSICPHARERIRLAYGYQPQPKAWLLQGVLNMLGQPLGVGQGNNPTCQSARALSMWAYNDPDYLLQMIVWATRDDDLVMHFEGQRLSSKELALTTPAIAPLDVDAVSAVLVPHLDRIYHAMGALCADRGDDPHRWINPEFHGWWVGRGFKLAVDLPTGKLSNYDDFVRYFYACYHPLHNGNQPLIYPQPVGLAVTDSAARFVGWHAITIQRVTLDQDEVMRVYFYNPNNDSGQDLGNGVKVSTEGRGERFGESSLPVAEFVSRLYIFHYDPLEHIDPAGVPAEDVAEVEALARGSWALER